MQARLLGDGWVVRGKMGTAGGLSAWKVVVDSLTLLLCVRQREWEVGIARCCEEGRWDYSSKSPELRPATEVATHRVGR